MRQFRKACVRNQTQNWKVKWNYVVRWKQKKKKGHFVFLAKIHVIAQRLKTADQVIFFLVVKFSLYYLLACDFRQGEIIQYLKQQWLILLKKNDLTGLLSPFKINSKKARVDKYINTDENQIQIQILKVVIGKKDTLSLKE